MRQTVRFLVMAVSATVSVIAVAPGGPATAQALTSVVVISRLPQEYGRRSMIPDRPSEVSQLSSIEPTADPTIHKGLAADGAVLFSLRVTPDGQIGGNIELPDGCAPSTLVDTFEVVDGRITRMAAHTFGECQHTGGETPHVEIQVVYREPEAIAVAFSQQDLDGGYMEVGFGRREEMIVTNVASSPGRIQAFGTTPSIGILDVSGCRDIVLAPGGSCTITATHTAETVGDTWDRLNIYWGRPFSYRYARARTGLRLDGGLFHPMPPTRMLDSRLGVGTTLQRPFGPGESRSIPIAGHKGIPPDAQGIIANVTATGPSAWSYLTVSPNAGSVPAVSNLNFNAGDTVANQSVLALGDSGEIHVRNEFGSVDVIVDVVGWIGPERERTGQRVILKETSSRVADTRPAGQPLKSGEVRVFPMKVTPAGATAVIANITAVSPTATTYLTAYAAGSARPEASILNTTAGVDRPNLVVVPIDPSGGLAVFNAFGSTHLIIDVLGYFIPQRDPWDWTGRIVLFEPFRFLDSRPNNALPGETIGVIEVGTEYLGRALRGLVVNATVDAPAAAGYVTVFPGHIAIPETSTLNFRSGQTVANQAWIFTTPTDRSTSNEIPPSIGYLNASSGDVQLLTDIQAAII